MTIESAKKLFEDSCKRNRAIGELEILLSTLSSHISAEEAYRHATELEEQKNLNDAYIFYAIAALQGHGEASYHYLANKDTISVAFQSLGFHDAHEEITAPVSLALKNKAAQGDVAAQYNCYRLFVDGKIIGVSPSQAWHYLTQSAVQKYSDAQNIYVKECLSRAESLRSTNPAEAIEYLQSAINQGSEIAKLPYINQCLARAESLSSIQPGEAIKYFRRAIAQGSASAAYQAGLLSLSFIPKASLFSKLTPEQEVEKQNLIGVSLMFFKKAVELGYHPAQNKIDKLQPKKTRSISTPTSTQVSPNQTSQSQGRPSVSAPSTVNVPSSSSSTASTPTVTPPAPGAKRALVFDEKTQQRTYSFTTMLAEVAQLSNTIPVTLQLKLNQKDAIGHTPLYDAVKAHEFKLAERMIDMGANPTIDDIGNVLENELEIEKNANARLIMWNDSNGLRTKIGEYQERLDRVEESVKHGSGRLDSRDIRVRNSKGQTALHRFIEAGEFADAVTLIDSGVDLNPADYESRTPIEYAIQQKAFYLALYMLNKGAKSSQAANALKMVPNKTFVRGYRELSQAISPPELPIVQREQGIWDRVKSGFTRLSNWLGSLAHQYFGYEDEATIVARQRNMALRRNALAEAEPLSKEKQAEARTTLRAEAARIFGSVVVEHGEQQIAQIKTALEDKTDVNLRIVPTTGSDASSDSSNVVTVIVDSNASSGTILSGLAVNQAPVKQSKQQVANSSLSNNEGGSTLKILNRPGMERVEKNEEETDSDHDSGLSSHASSEASSPQSLDEGEQGKNRRHSLPSCVSLLNDIISVQQHDVAVPRHR